MEELQRYYIVMLEDRYVVIKTHKTHSELTKEAFDVYGCFGRKDYAHHWCDYKNGKITTKQHKEFLFNR